MNYLNEIKDHSQFSAAFEKKGEKKRQVRNKEIEMVMEEKLTLLRK